MPRCPGDGSCFRNDRVTERGWDSADLCSLHSDKKFLGSSSWGWVHNLARSELNRAFYTISCQLSCNSWPQAHPEPISNSTQNMPRLIAGSCAWLGVHIPPVAIARLTSRGLLSHINWSVYNSCMDMPEVMTSRLVHRELQSCHLALLGTQHRGRLLLLLLSIGIYCPQGIKVSAVCWRETIQQQAQNNMEKTNSTRKILTWKHREYFLSLVHF